MRTDENAMRYCYITHITRLALLQLMIPIYTSRLRYLEMGSTGRHFFRHVIERLCELAAGVARLGTAEFDPRPVRAKYTNAGGGFVQVRKCLRGAAPCISVKGLEHMTWSSCLNVRSVDVARVLQ